MVVLISESHRDSEPARNPKPKRSWRPVQRPLPSWKGRAVAAGSALCAAAGALLGVVGCHFVLKAFVAPFVAASVLAWTERLGGAFVAAAFALAVEALAFRLLRSLAGRRRSPDDPTLN